MPRTLPFSQIPDIPDGRLFRSFPAKSKEGFYAH
jgi:hypothetical protein